MDALLFTVLTRPLQKTLKAATLLSFWKGLKNKMIEQAYSILFTVVLICLGIAAFIALIRSITGKTMITRFICTNVLSTITLIAICILAILFKENYLPDIAIVYALLSCIVVMLLCKIYINLFEKKEGGKNND